MKRWKKLLVSLLTVSMTIGASTMSVMAADGYTYKVTLSAGNKGTINGQAKVEQDSLFAGSTVTFNLKNVQVTDDKYYVKGIRLSGRDNEETLASPVLDNVTGDADYVVAYGIKKDMVAYTVNYQDASGKALAESQTFYGNVGDKPIVAYQYIENYIPDALALTKTLSNNVSENVFTFTYKPGATDRVVIQQQPPSQRLFLVQQLLAQVPVMPVQQVAQPAQPVELPAQPVELPELPVELQPELPVAQQTEPQPVQPMVQRQITILRIRQTIQPPNRMNRHQSLW